jgi:hypothetical protein
MVSERSSTALDAAFDRRLFLIYPAFGRRLTSFVLICVMAAVVTLRWR